MAVRARLQAKIADHDAITELQAHCVGLQDAHNSLCQASDREVNELKHRVEELEKAVAEMKEARTDRAPPLIVDPTVHLRDMYGNPLQ
jgi:FtsZ-binding cell division protein ZapB